MPKQPTIADNVITGLQVINAQNASGIATQGNIATVAPAAAVDGVKPGRRVFDPITQTWGTVVGSAVAYLPPDQIPQGANSGK